MKEATREKAQAGFHDAFLFTVVGKGVFAFLEVILGITFFFTNSIALLIMQLINNELIEDPSDFFAEHVQPFLHPTPETQIFTSFYLLSHGIVKLFLVWGLLRNKSWSYPASIAVFTLFIMYQLFRYFFKTHSGWLLVITVVDLVAIWLIYHEYRQALKRVTISSNGPGTPSAA